MPFSKLNYINVGPHGTFKPSGNLHTTPADIDALFAHLSASNAARLAVHFHGGLVKEGKGRDIAESMQPVYEAGGAHAVTFIWETGLVETLTRNLTRIDETKLFQKLVRYVFRQLTKRLGGDLSGRGPGEPMTMEEIEAELSKLERFEEFEATARGGAATLHEADLEFAREEMELEYLLELQGDQDFADEDFETLKGDTELGPAPREELRGDDGRGISLFQVAKFLAKVTYRVIRRYIRKRDHGLYPTVIEEILREFYLADLGQWVWGRMKDVSAEMWLPNGPEINEMAHPGTYFLAKLNAHQTAHPDFKLDLIGHSAGSIAICHLLRAADAAGTLPRIRNIAFLAPACLTRLMHAEVVSHPERFEAFRMYTMSDAFESEDQLVKRIYTRSLLYLISGVLEEEADIPVAGMARFWSAAAPFDDAYLVQCANWLTQAGENRAVLSVTSDPSPVGMQSASRSHGDFDNDTLTRASLTHLVGRE